MISEWLEEDCPSFDYGGFVVGEEMAEARLLGKSAVGRPKIFNNSSFGLLFYSQEVLVRASLGAKILRAYRLEKPAVLSCESFIFRSDIS